MYTGVDDLKATINKLKLRVDSLESRVKTMEEKPSSASPVVPSSKAEVITSVPPSAAPKDVDEDDNIDLFGSDSEVCLKCE
jgi:hypothetical protein